MTDARWKARPSWGAHGNRGRVTGAPISHRDGALRLYRGATPDAPVDEMYSFFPAIRADGDTGFPRPRVSLPSRHFRKNVQYAKGQALGRSDLATEDLRDLWECLVSQVRRAGLVTGTHATLPGRRGNERNEVGAQVPN